MELKAIDHALVALRAGGAPDYRLFPIPDFQVHEAAQAIDVFDLAHPADGKPIAVARKSQSADAAEGALALPGIVGVERRNLKALGQLARLRFPDADLAVPVAAGQ